MTQPEMTPKQIADMIARAEKKIAKARQFTLRFEAFFATTMKNLDFIMVDDGSSMGTDGTRLLWDVRFVAKLSQVQVNFVILHEILHVVLMHHLRLKGRDKALANVAMDHVVNMLLTTSGMAKPIAASILHKWTPEMIANPDLITLRNESYRMPEGGVMDPRFVGMSFEDVYAILLKEQDKGEDEDGKGKGKPAKPEWGEVTEATDENGKTLTPEAMEELEQELLDDLVIAEHMAKSRGQMSAGMSQVVKEIRAPSQPWEEILRDLMTQDKTSSSSYAIQNKRHPGSTLIYPGRKRKSFGHLCVMADASGSVSNGEWTQFMSDLWAICEDLNPAKVTMIQFDHIANAHQEIDDGETPDLTRQMHGGTRFQAPFEYAEKEGLMDDFQMILFFTDGGDNGYPEEPPCPVIWASTGAFWGGNPPFGECVQVKFGR